MSKKYKIGYAPVYTGGGGKATTHGFKTRTVKSSKVIMKMLLRYSTVPVKLQSGWRSYENVTKIFDWLRIDCDVGGEYITVREALDAAGVEYFELPSTSYDPKHKPYKKHFHVVCKGAANDVAKYKWQMKRALETLGLWDKLNDIRLSTICVQNANPYANGGDVKGGLKIARHIRGKALKLERAPDELVYRPTDKIMYGGEGQEEHIPLKVKEEYEKLMVLSPESGIVVGDAGWVRVGDLDLEPGESMGNLSCPGQNSEHSKGCCHPGYAFATMNERGELWITCTGASCRGRYYKVDDGIPVGSGDLIDTLALRAYVRNTWYHPASGMYTWVSSSGRPREFRKNGVTTYWNDIEVYTDDFASFVELGITANVSKYLMAGDEDRAKMKLFNQEVARIVRFELGIHDYRELFNDDYTINRSYIKEKLEAYLSKHIELCLEYVEREHQVGSVVYESDPFGKNGVTFRKRQNSVVVNTTDVLGEAPKPVVWPEAVREYVDHFPQFYELLDFLVAVRMGGDPKKAYLWMQLPSDWGKSWLFDHVLGPLSVVVTESELKKAMKGEPSGLSPDNFVGKLFLFVDEFRSPIAELKNITHSLSITPKGRMKMTVPVYGKIFASAEDVENLVSDTGIEMQFSNRFMHMKPKTETLLVDLPLYKGDRVRYSDAIKYEAYRYMRERLKPYLERGDRAYAARLGDRVIDEMRERYKIEGESLSEAIEPLVQRFVDDIDKWYADNEEFRWCARDKKGRIYIDRTMGRVAKEFFLHNYFAKSDQPRHAKKNLQELLYLKQGRVRGRFVYFFKLKPTK